MIVRLFVWKETVHLKMILIGIWLIWRSGLLLAGIQKRCLKIDEKGDCWTKQVKHRKILLMEYLLLLHFTLNLRFWAKKIKELEIKVELSPSKKLFYVFQRKRFKNDEECFLFCLKSLFSFSRYLNRCLDFSVM